MVLPHIALESGKNPQYSIIWLHGLGADGHDFVPMLDELKLPAAVRFIFPHATKIPVTINGGFIMRAWYDIKGTTLGSRQDEAGIRRSQAAIEALIAQENARGIANDHIFLAGFSQGGAIVLHTALRQSQPLAGALALSTYLPLAELATQEITCHTTPIFMAHGRSDTVVTHELGQHSCEQLRTLNCAVEWHDYAMQHSVCAEELVDIQKWLKERMAGS